MADTGKIVGIALGAFVLYSLFGKKSGGGLISKNYGLSDLTRSDTATREGISEQFERPSEEILRNAKFYAQNVLEPIAEYLGQPAFTESWYRSPALNEAVGGVDDSLHLLALASDLQHQPGAKRIVEAVYKQSVPFHKLIISGSEINPNTIHISLKPSGNAGKIYYKTGPGSYREVSPEYVRRKLGF